MMLTGGNFAASSLLRDMYEAAAVERRFDRRPSRRALILRSDVRILSLSPLVLLAACGSGGAGPMPPPPPTIAGQPDTAAITAGSPVATGNVLSNDIGTGGTLSVTAVAIEGGTAGTIGQPLTGTFGALTINADGSYSFALASNAAVQALGAGATARDTFTYTPSVGRVVGTTQTLTVTVTGVNESPVAIDDLGSVTEDAAISRIVGNVRTNDTDVDAGTTLSVTAVAGGTVGSSVQGIYGAVVINSDGSYAYTLNNADADTHALNAGQTAVERFTYTVSDGATTASAALIVTVGGASEPAQPPSGALRRIDLSNLGANGVVVAIRPDDPVYEPEGLLGTVIASVRPGDTGDVTGDGVPDLVVARPGGRPAIFVFSGTDLTGFAPSIILTPNAFPTDFLKNLAVGNIGGDARADLLFGARTPGAGSVYALFDVPPGEIDVRAVPPVGSAGFTLTTPDNEPFVSALKVADNPPAFGSGVAILGDMNSDGRNDFFVSAPERNFGGVQDVGESFIGFGRTTYPSVATDVSSLSSPEAGLQLRNAPVADGNGFTSAATGNVNGSGGQDLMLGNMRAATVDIRFDALPGESIIDNSDLNGANGVRLFSSRFGSRLGETIAVGDINGDGRADVIIGDYGANATYILLGAPSYAPGRIDVANPGTAPVIAINGVSSGFGRTVAYVGDFNGDGFGDFAVASWDGTRIAPATERAYIMLGSASPSAATYNLTTSPNVILLDNGGRGTGTTIAGPGDLNQDGFADVAIGRADAFTTAPGSVIVVYGRSTAAASGMSNEAVPDALAEAFGGDSLPEVASIVPADALVHQMPLA